MQLTWRKRMKILLEKIQYDKCCWTICYDLKVTALLMDWQLGYTKFCCFLCEWDSRDKKNLELTDEVHKKMYLFQK